MSKIRRARPTMHRICCGLGSILLILTITWKEPAAADIIANVVDDSGAAIAHTVVYADPKSGTAPALGAEKAIVDQVDKLFTPFVSAVRVGTRVIFPNRDNIKHHVYSFSRPKQFELPLYAGRAAPPVLFDKEGEIVMGCNIHDWMMAHVLVVKTPYFSVTDKNGQAHLNNLPSGDYTVRVWHPGMKRKPKTKPQTVSTSAGNQELIFTIRLKAKRKWWRDKPYDAEIKYYTK